MMFNGLYQVPMRLWYAADAVLSGHNADDASKVQNAMSIAEEKKTVKLGEWRSVTTSSAVMLIPWSAVMLIPCKNTYNLMFIASVNGVQTP